VTIRHLAAIALLSLPFAVACGGDESEGGDNDECVAGKACTCSGDSCSQTCGGDGGNCDFQCGEGQSCDFFCPGGSCAVTCNGSASCNLECEGEGCSLNCSGTDSCVVDSCSTGCSTQCGGAEVCESSCDVLEGCQLTP